MRHEAAQQALSVAMDEGRRGPEDAVSHVRQCRTCTEFERRAWRLRELARFQVAPEVPDLSAAIMSSVRAEAGRPRAARPAAPGQPRRWRPWLTPALARAAAVALVVGFVAGVTITRGSRMPSERVAPASLSREIPAKLVGAAEQLSGYRATFDVTELGWTTAVGRRTFTAEIGFRAPEAFFAHVRDTTRYPPGPVPWPRNDLDLITNGRTWHESGPDPCPRAALPACPEVASVDRTVSGRPPFDAPTAMPTDVIVPMTVLGAAGRVDVLGESTVSGREAVEVALTAEDGASLFQYVQFLGSWRPFFPQDRLVVWLDRQTWFPLQYEVFPAAGADRAAWAAQNGLPSESPEQAVFSATVRSFSPIAPPAARFAVARDADVVDQGFRDRTVETIHPAIRPGSLEGLQPWRVGGFVHRNGRPLRQVVAAYARGLSWATVTRVLGWDQRRPFGVGAFAEPVELPGGGVGLYEPASGSDPRRLSLHTPQGEFLVATNLPRADLERLAGSLPARGLPQPSSWRIHRWAGGVVEDGLTPAQGLARAGLPAALPGFLPPGFAPAVARLVRTPSSRTVTIVFRHDAAELGGVGILFTQGIGLTLAPPSEVGVMAVGVGRSVARWSPGQHLLEWMDGGVYRSLSSPSLELSTLLQVATSVRPVSGATP
ncbi:MAG TPA: hypothetical protein VKA30_11525 [Actinomycetota bacterium]|nr:hypothetical protein [Actinomycetota bacterium]